MDIVYEICTDVEVMEMLREYESEKKVNLHVMSFIPQSFVGSNPMQVACDFAGEGKGNGDDVQALYESCSEDEVDIEKETIELEKELNRRKELLADPNEHCEGDTDCEDFFTTIDDTHVREVDSCTKVRPRKVIQGKRTKKRKPIQRKVVAAKDVLALSDPLSESGEEPIRSEDNDMAGDESTVLKTGKRKRSRPHRLLEKRLMWNEDQILDPTQLCKGMCFTDGRQFRRALKSYHIMNERDYGYIRNDGDRVKVHCTEEMCSFFMHAFKIAGESTFQIRKMIAPHTCGVTRASTRVDSVWLSQRYEEEIRSDPNWDVKALQDAAMRDFGVEVSATMAYRTKARAADKVLGSHKGQYRRIRDYCQTIVDKNPGSTVVVATEPRADQGLNPRFDGLFICLNALNNGFKNGCRPFIGMDGCFVKLTNGAQILAATARDGNNNLFLLAFGIVGKEDIHSWKWFCQRLCEAIGEVGENGPWVIMSDRQKGLLNAVADTFPNSEHRYCKRHLYQNFCNAGYRGGNLKEHMDSAVYAYTRSDYEVAMEKLKKESEKESEKAY